MRIGAPTSHAPNAAVADASPMGMPPVAIVRTAAPPLPAGTSSVMFHSCLAQSPSGTPRKYGTQVTEVGKLDSETFALIGAARLIEGHTPAAIAAPPASVLARNLRLR